MNGGGVFRVKPVQRGGGAHACNRVLPHKDVECCQASQEIRLLGRVNAIPDTNKAAVLDLHVELLTGHDFEQLLGGGEPAQIP